MEFVIDRFEGDFAIVELTDGKTVELPKVVLPDGAKEGDTVKVIIDADKTAQSKKEIENLMNDVWED